jgi:hypothetical protein
LEIIEAFEFRRASTVRRPILRNLFLRESGFRLQQARLGGKAGEELAKTSRARRSIDRIVVRAVGRQDTRRRRMKQPVCRRAIAIAGVSQKSTS